MDQWPGAVVASESNVCCKWVQERVKAESPDIEKGGQSEFESKRQKWAGMDVGPDCQRPVYRSTLCVHVNTLMSTHMQDRICQTSGTEHPNHAASLPSSKPEHLSLTDREAKAHMAISLNFS